MQALWVDPQAWQRLTTANISVIYGQKSRCTGSLNASADRELRRCAALEAGPIYRVLACGEPIKRSWEVAVLLSGSRTASV
jgi:hypothetical protein